MDHNSNPEEECYILLTSKLVEAGIPAPDVEAHVQKLVRIIILSAIKELAEEKGLDLAPLRDSAPSAKSQFIQDHFTDEELGLKIKIETERQVRDYLSVLSRGK